MGDASRQQQPDSHLRGRNHRAVMDLPIRRKVMQMKSCYKIVGRFAMASQALLLLLSGCAAGVVQGAVAVKDMGERRMYQAAAEAGDPQAEFNLGDFGCCTVTKRADNRRHAIHSNEKATEWLCRAALQNYGPAQMELARIYAGRTFRYNIMKQAADRVLGAPKDPAVALMWTEIAETNKVDGAARLRVSLMEEATPAVQIEAGQRKVSWQTSPCAWQEIMQQDGNLT